MPLSLLTLISILVNSGACPVRIADKDALFEEENHHHQRYNVRLSTAAECVIHGWDNGPTTMSGYFGLFLGQVLRSVRFWAELRNACQNARKTKPKIRPNVVGW